MPSSILDGGGCVVVVVVVVCVGVAIVLVLVGKGIREWQGKVSVGVAVVFGGKVQQAPQGQPGSLRFWVGPSSGCRRYGQMRSLDSVQKDEGNNVFVVVDVVVVTKCRVVRDIVIVVFTPSFQRRNRPAAAANERFCWCRQRR